MIFADTESQLCVSALFIWNLTKYVLIEIFSGNTNWRDLQFQRAICSPTPAKSCAVSEEQCLWQYIGATSCYIFWNGAQFQFAWSQQTKPLILSCNSFKVLLSGNFPSFLIQQIFDTRRFSQCTVSLFISFISSMSPQMIEQVKQDSQSSLYRSRPMEHMLSAFQNGNFISSGPHDAGIFFRRRNHYLIVLLLSWHYPDSASCLLKKAKA